MAPARRTRLRGASRSGSLYPLGPCASSRVMARRPRRRIWTSARVMRPWSQVRQSRTQWKHKATPRAAHERSLRNPLSRVKTARDRATTALKEAQAHLPQLETQSRGLAVPPQVDLVFFVLQLVCVARSGLRAVSRVLRLLAAALGLKQAPCPQTLIHWVTRLSSVRIPSARRLQGVALSPAPFAHGLIWMMEVRSALGAGKRVAVVALDAQHHPRTPVAPGRQPGRGRAVSVAAAWTGAPLAAWRKRLIAVMGRPAASRKDGGSELHKAIDVLAAQGLARPSMDAIAPAVAPMRKRRDHHHPHCATLLSACGRVAGTLKHTLLACLAPPTVHTKARLMTGQRLVPWADRWRTLAPAGSATAGSTLAT